jgi:GxxExxY protein
MRTTQKYLNELTYKVIGCAIEVHRHLGPGLLESVYEKCFSKELELQGVAYRNQVSVPLEYKGIELDAELRLDVLVEDLLCVELKAQEGLLPLLVFLTNKHSFLLRMKTTWGRKKPLTAR